MTGKPGLTPDSRTSPLTQKAIEYLIDGEWKPREPLIQALIPKVHPGKAARQAERTRVGYTDRATPAPKERVRNTEDNRVFRIGARSLVRDTLRAKIFEQKDGMVRISPDRLERCREFVEARRKGGEAASHRKNDRG